MSTAKAAFTKNQYLQGQVIDLTHEGLGVVKIDKYPFFIEGVIPGETVQFKIIKVGKHFGFGRLEEILQASPDRVEVTDTIGRVTGTMTLQHMTYDRQLAFKQEVVRQAFQRIGKFEAVQVAETVGMDHPWAYRNKAQIPVREVKGLLSTGIFRKNSHELVAVEDYRIQDPQIDQAILKIRDILRQFHYQAYDEETHTGLIRHIIVKRGHHSGQMMVVLVTTKDQLPHQENLVSKIRQELPDLVSLIQNTNAQVTNVIMGPDSRTLWGQDFIEDTMLGLTLRISAQSFYQVNTPQAEKLYSKAIELGQINATDTVMDAYCGIGSISLALAQHAGQVHAMEIVPEAIAMAKKNAQLNQIDNIEFQAGPAEDWIKKWQDQGIHFNTVVVDPPRKGLDDNFIQTLIELTPDKIVYISCNPASQARDCRILADAGYEIGEIYPFDLFPQTYHVETCAVLTKSSASED